MNGKIVIIGAGHVGSHCASALAMQAIAKEIVLLDIDREKASAQAKDIADTMCFMPASTVVRTGEYADCNDADLIFISIGQPRKPGQTRLDLVYDSMEMLREVVSHLKECTISGIVVTITNPADVIAYYTRKWLHLPKTRCFSTGTLLDTSRLLRAVSEASGIDRKSVYGFSMGEHGDSSMIPFSALSLGGRPFSEWNLQKEEILQRTRNIGNEIINGKGSTEFGIGAAAAALARTIFFDERRVLPVSVLLEGEYGQTDLNVGVPCVIGKNGVEQVLELPLTQEEREQFASSCAVIRGYIEKFA